MEPAIIMYNPQCAKPGYQRMPAALLQIASFIEGIYPYVIVDGNLDQGDDHAAEIVQLIRREDARYLAISIMPGPQLTSAVRDLRKIRQACPGVVVIVGGYFPTLHPEVCLADRDIDYVITGPGERPFRDLIDALEQGRPAGNIAGVGHQGQSLMNLPVMADPVHPDQLPDIPYHRIDVARYLVGTFLGSRTLSHHSSFGCPFRCSFCGVVHQAQGRWYGESATRLADRVEYLVKNWGMNGLEYHDNNFFASEARVEDFCNQILERGVRVGWWGEGRIDTLHGYADTTWEVMAKSGLKMVFLGAESGSDDTLKAMNKGGVMTSGLTLSLVERMKEYGIIPELSFIMGNPPHPREDIERGISYIRKIKRINPRSEIILYRYDPVPVGGELFQAVRETGFRFPATLDEWVEPNWRAFQRRKTANLTWMSRADQAKISDFQTVLNAYYPTATARHLAPGSWEYYLLKMAAGLRFHLRWYRRPLLLQWLQKKLAYQRPEISGF